MSNNKLNKDGVKAFWDRVFILIKKITGDVDVENKGTLQEQVNGVTTRVEECFTFVSNGKKAVANAITGKGISTAEDAEFATMAENIGKIKSTPKLQSKSTTLDTRTTSVTMKPDTGYDGLDQATAKIVLQEKSVTLGTSAQNITPDSGKLLSKVTVPAVPGNAALTHVLTGKTFSSATAGVDKTGTMANKAGTTVKASAISQDDNNTYLTIPAAGYYDVTSKVYTENSNLSRDFDYYEFNAKTGYILNLGYKPRLLYWMHSNDETYTRKPARISTYISVNNSIPGTSGGFYYYFDTVNTDTPGSFPKLSNTSNYNLSSISDDGILTFNKFPNYPYVRLWAMK